MFLFFLAGSLRFLSIVLKMFPSEMQRIAPSLLEDIFRITFVTPGVRVRCLTLETREAAFELLAVLSKSSSEAFAQTLERLKPVIRDRNEEKIERGDLAVR